MNLTYVHMISVQLSKTYGPVFTVYFGLKKVIVIAGYRAVKEALVNHAEEFGNREVTPVFYDFNKGHGKKILFELVTIYFLIFFLLKRQFYLLPGILFSNGDSWKEMRRFALSTLKDFGMGKRISEGKIIDECHYLIQEFKQHQGNMSSTEQFDKFKQNHIG